MASPKEEDDYARTSSSLPAGCIIRETCLNVLPELVDYVAPLTGSLAKLSFLGWRYREACGTRSGEEKDWQGVEM